MEPPSYARRTWLAEADQRGAQLIHINPLLEAASGRMIVPHEFVVMAIFHTTETGTVNVQVRIGGDMALIRGVAKAVVEAAEKDRDVLDREFIKQHTKGFDEYRTLEASTPWSELVWGSGIAESDIRKLADSYMASKRVILAWCLGITQHEHGTLPFSIGSETSAVSSPRASTGLGRSRRSRRCTAEM